ncbi:MAG: winged helix-turn-helix transcriptional regulator [Thaumarchaeota archaeon]|nr:winged helix-turn-helix transcriptional regulator [Nitrososphaerota archaeon]
MKSTVFQPNQVRSHTAYAKNVFYSVFVTSRGGPNRTRLMWLIRRGHVTNARVAKLLGLNYLTVKYHLQVLERNNLVIHKGEKRNVMFSISTFFEINSVLFDEICRLNEVDVWQPES